MAFDPNQPFTLLDEEPAAPQGFDPSKPFELIETPAPAGGFDPSKPFELLEEPQAAPGARFDVQAAAEESRGRTAPGDVTSAAVRGALSQGLLAGAEGFMRGAQATSNALAQRIVRSNLLGEEYAKLGATLGDLERAEMLGSSPARAAQVQQIRARMQAIEADKAAAIGGAESFQGEQLKPLARTFSGARRAVDEAFPVSPEFEASLGGQIISGLGQAVGTLPFYVVPVVGGAMSVGQLFQEGYDDALRNGADEATANKVGMANVPASALDILADRFVVGRILKPFKGKMTVGQLARSIAVSAPVEGVTEGAQQAWQNYVAQRLVGYDPKRQLDDEVINSMIVGAVVGGAVAGVGGAVANRFASPAPASAETPGAQPAPPPQAATPPPAQPGAAPAAAQPPAAGVTPPAAGPTDADFTAAAQAARAPLALPPATEALAPAAPAAIAPAAGTETPPPPSAATAMAPSLPEGAPQRAAVEGSTGLEAGASVPPPTEPVKPMSRRQMADMRRQIRELDGKAQRAAQTSPERAGEYTQQAQDLRQQLAQAEANRPRGVGPAVGLGADGNPDLLSDIAEYVGRIRTVAPEGANAQGGEYDGWNETLNEGAARLLRGRDRGMKPDEVVETLNNNGGYKFQSIGELQEAIRRAVAQRRKLGEEFQQEAYRNRVEDMARTNTRTGRRADLRPKDPTVIQNIGEGGSFTLNREKFSVVDIKDDPDNGETVYVIQDGHRFEVPHDTPIFADRDSIQPGKVETPVDPFDFPAPDQPAAATPPPTPEAAPLAPKQEVAALTAELGMADLGQQYTRPPELVQKLQRLGTLLLPGVRLQEAESLAQLHILQQRGEVTAAEIAKYRNDLIKGGYVRMPDGSQQEIAGVENAFNLTSEEQAPQPTAEEQRRAEAEARAEAARQSDLFGAGGDEEPRPGRSGAMGSTPFASPPPTGVPPTQPPRTAPPPAADPNFTQLPIELPEAVKFFNILTQGKYPKVRERLRALKGQAAGVFRYREGQIDSGEIELRADQFNLLSAEEKNALLQQAVEWAKAITGVDKGPEFQAAVKARFEQLVAEAEEESIKAGPRRALAVFWHEIGHFLDFYPTATTKRGNILGRLASLNNYFKSYLGKAPGIIAEPPTASERAKLYDQAERELSKDIETIVETIRREEPVYREVAITADEITNIVKNAARTDYPGFYDWFAKLDRKDKVDVLKQAMRGIVDERVKRFNRREPTGETRIVEEQITRTTGAPPTSENIKARFEELLRAELERRGLINETEIREELSRAIAWWRGVDEIPDYYKTSVEMWADTMSIFFNNPRGLAEKAPKFYYSFMQWMAAKPGLREEYDKFQRDIASGQIYKDRVQDLRDSWRRDAEAAVLLDEAGTKTTLASLLDYARLLFDRQFGPIERKIAKKAGRTGPLTLEALGNYRYRTTAWEAYALDLRNQVEVKLAEAGLTHDDLAEYMFHKRITEGSRRDLANPLGWNPKNSRERLAEMERDLGPERWAALVATQEAQRRVYQKHVIQLLHRASVMSPQLAEAVDSEFFYAPFNKARVFTGANTDAIESLLRLNYGNEATGAIYSQVGNLGEIRSPYVQMQHRAFGLISMAYRQLALKSVIRYLQENDPLAVVEAPMRFNGRTLEPVAVNNDEVATLYVLEQGKVRAYYVKRIIAEMFSKGSVIEMRLTGAAHRVLGLPKALLTELNPGFWPVAFVKDVGNAAIQLPRGAGVLGNLRRAYQASRATFNGRPDPLATRVLERNMVISRADSRGEHLGHADEMTRILMRLGKTPVMWNGEVGRIERVLREFFQAWARQGQILERTVKIASMMTLDQRFPHMAEAQKRQLVRELGGSPDFLSKGRRTAQFELVFGMMFWNAWKESVRSQYRAMRTDPRGYWTKFAGTVGIAAATLWAFESGLLSWGGGEDEEDYRDKLRSIPERDKLRGFVIPLGWVDKANGKVAYVVLPFPDSLRWAHALQRKALQSTTAEGTSKQGLESMLEYQAGDLPGQNPFFTAVKEYWAYYVQGRNPYDNFTGRGALDQTAVDARQADAELAKRTLSNVTGGIAYRFKPQRPGESEADVEKFLNLPFVSNLLGRWVRVSNRGLDELYREATEPVQREQASLRLIGEEMIGRTFRGEGWTPEQTSLLSESPYLANYLINAMPRLAAQADSPFLRQLTQAQTQAEKLAVVEIENERQRQRQQRQRAGSQIVNPISLPPEPVPQR